MLIFFLLLLIPNVSVIAHECVPACTGCQTCEAGVCVDDDDKCGSSVCCDGTCCSAGQTCCNGTCCEACCDGITPYNPATETCCGDGYGTVCSGSSPCCLDVPGGISFCTAYCYDSVCCSSAQWCCDNVECCDYPCCGTECCGATEYCCGDPSWNELCCNNDEVCCWYIDGSGNFVFYCNPPCTEEVINTTTCSEDNEENYACIGCTSPLPPNCTAQQYQDYSGLEIKECHDGCWWQTPDELCYEQRYCLADIKENHYCMECQGKWLCIPCLDTGSSCICEEPSIAGCIINVSCFIASTCFKCITGGELIDTFKMETCNCIY